LSPPLCTAIELTLRRKVGWDAEVPRKVIRIIVKSLSGPFDQWLKEGYLNYSAPEGRSEEPYLEFHCSPWLRKSTLIENQHISEIRNRKGAI